MLVSLLSKESSLREPRVDWGLVVASRLTFAAPGEGWSTRQRSEKPAVKPSDADVLRSMAEGRSTGGVGGRRLLSPIINRLIAVALLSCGLLAIAAFFGRHDSSTVFRVCKAIPATAMIFCGALAILMQRRWRQMGSAGAFPRRWANILVPVVLGAATFFFYMAV